MREHSAGALLHHPLHPCIQRRNARHIDRSRFQRIRQEIRHGERCRNRSRSALHQRFQRDGAVRQQHARAHDAVQPLVPRRAEQLDAVLQRDRQDAAALRAVRNEDQTVLPAERCDLAVGQDLSGDIADQRADDCARLRTDQAAECGDRFGIVRGDRRNAVRDHARCGERRDRTRCRIVLQTAHDDMIAAPQCPVDRKIQRMGAVLRENDMLRHSAEQRGGGLPRVKHGAACPLRKRMPAASGIAAGDLHCLHQRVPDGLRLRIGRRRVIEIDWSVHRCQLLSVMPVQFV